MSNHLAKIERVGVREGWHREDNEFTPWLAENIAELGKALRLEFSDVRTEERMDGSSRRVDIVATSNDQQVVIENQLEITDNDHLSRLLIYAAGKDAKTVIWVASEFSEEHRQVLDWLNQNTDETVLFFGVAVELWKIDGSRPAPHFRVAIEPNDWRKQNISVQRTLADSAGIQNRNFRRALANQLRGSCSIEIPRERHDYAYAILEHLAGNPLRYAAIWGGAPAVEFIIEKKGTDGPEWSRSVFEQLKQHQEAIESALIDPGQDEEFVWKPVGQWSGGIGCQIAIFRPGSVHNNAEEWGEYRSWIIAKYLRFREVLARYLAEILAQTEDAPEPAE